MSKHLHILHFEKKMTPSLLIRHILRLSFVKGSYNIRPVIAKALRESATFTFIFLIYVNKDARICKQSHYT